MAPCLPKSGTVTDLELKHHNLFAVNMHLNIRKRMYAVCQFFSKD